MFKSSSAKEFKGLLSTLKSEILSTDADSYQAMLNKVYKNDTPAEYLDRMQRGIGGTAIHPDLEKLKTLKEIADAFIKPVNKLGTAISKYIDSDSLNYAYQFAVNYDKPALEKALSEACPSLAPARSRTSPTSSTSLVSVFAARISSDFVTERTPLLSSRELTRF